MGDEDDGLGLSLRLSLGCAQNHHHHPSKLNLISLATSPTMQHNTTTWNQLFHSSDRVSWFRGINVNRETTDCEDEGWVSSPNSNISSISGKKNEREQVGDETEAEIDSCSSANDDEDGVVAASRKKLRLFEEQSLKKPSRKIALLIWTKLKQVEVNCEYLKRCCENLTQENRMLHKEVQELRALTLSPQHYMHMNLPTTLTMCSSCERVAPSSSVSNSIAPNRPQMNPWAALPITTHRSFNALASRS